jgi:hypothetical protein
MPESVFTQTMPLLSAGGVCCCAVVAGLAGAEEADEFAGVGIARGVGLLVAGGGAELAAGAPSAEVFADFLERDFFVLPESAAEASALEALSAGFLERDFFVVVAESAAAVPSAASADFPDRLFFLGVVSASAEAVAASEESALLFFERLFFVPESAAALSAVLAGLSAAFSDFLDLLFFGLLLSAVVLSASELALFLERLFLVVVESAAVELSALFFFDLDFVLLESAESAALCEESSALAFFLDFLVVELSVGSVEPACCARVETLPQTSSNAASSARTTPLLAFIGSLPVHSAQDR